MKTRLLLVAFCVLQSSLTFGGDLEPLLQSAPMPFYPPLCRIARLQGEVTVSFTVNEQGDTTNIKADGPNELLKQAALQNVKNWKYSWNSPCFCHVYRTVIVKYVLGNGSDDKGADTMVRWFGKSPVNRVEIEAGPTVINTHVSNAK